MVCGSSRRTNTGLHGSFQSGCREGMVDDIKVIELAVPYSNYAGFVRRSWAFLLFALRSIGIALREEYDLIFATSTPLTAGIPAITSRWLRGQPFVFEVRDLWPELPREMGVITNPVVLILMDWLEWLSYHSAHHLIGLSPGIVQGIIGRGIPPERISMIPNGSDLDLFDSDRYDRAEIRIPGVNDDDFVAAFTGAHGIANGLDAALDAAVVLKERGLDHIKLVFIGDGKLKPHLIRRTKQEQLDNCLFLAAMPKTALARVMARVDIGLMLLANVPAFYYGTSPNKFFDYIAAGLPVLINYPGWLADLIRKSDSGWIVPPEDPVAFADILEDAAACRHEVEKRGLHARILAQSQFGRASLAARFEHTLLTTLETKRTSP